MGPTQGDITKNWKPVYSIVPRCRLQVMQSDVKLEPVGSSLVGTVFTLFPYIESASSTKRAYMLQEGMLQSLPFYRLGCITVLGNVQPELPPLTSHYLY